MFSSPYAINALRGSALTLVAILALPGWGGDRPGDGTTARPPAGKPAVRPAPAPTATRAAMLRQLRGRRVVVGARRSALDPAPLTCDAAGPARRRGGALTWARFHCVQPTFPPGATVGPDLVFFAEPAGRGRGLHVSGARLTRY